MLSSIHIENVAVIKKMDADLSSGFTVLTGETGAGKSILPILNLTVLNLTRTAVLHWLKPCL